MDTRQRNRMRGQSLVEFALIVGVLSLIFLGLFDLGRVYNGYIVITNCAREGARYGSMHPDDPAGIRNRAIREADNSGIVLTADDVGIDTTGGSGDPIAVTVEYDFLLLSAWAVGRDTLRLRSRVEMVNL